MKILLFFYVILVTAFVILTIVEVERLRMDRDNCIRDIEMYQMFVKKY